MKTKQSRALTVVAALLLAAIACGGSFSTANIREAYTATDDTGAQQTSVFSQEQNFYCIVELANAPDDTVVKAVWIAVNAEDVDPNFEIFESETESGDGALYFELTNDYLWPVGQYKVDLYLNGELDRSITFEVR